MSCGNASGASEIRVNPPGIRLSAEGRLTPSSLVCYSCQLAVLSRHAVALEFFEPLRAAFLEDLHGLLRCAVIHSPCRHPEPPALRSVDGFDIDHVPRDAASI